LKQNKNLKFFFILPNFYHVNFPDMNRKRILQLTKIMWQ